MSNKKTISDSLKQQVAKLVDKEFISRVLSEKLAEYYPDFKKLKLLDLVPHKNYIGRTSAVFVTEYNLVYLSSEKIEKKLCLFSTGHSDGSRKGAYEKLKLLYDNGFDKGLYTVTKPLFFLEEQQGFFYEASEGRSLYHWFAKEPELDLHNSIELAAGWIKKLHNVSIKLDFAFPQFAIANMVPSPDDFLADFKDRNIKQGQRAEKLINQMQVWEAKFNREHKLGLIYGDYHPENIIINNPASQELKMIDFTDVALGDPMIDVATFLKQFNFMGQRFINDDKMLAYKNQFMESYFGKPNDKLEIHYFQRINLYQCWTAMRTSVFLFYQHKDESVNEVLNSAEKYLSAVDQESKSIHLW